MDIQKKANCTNLDWLTRLTSLSFLPAVALRELANGLRSASSRKGEVVFTEEELAADVHILLTGIAKITGLNRCGQRVTLALLGPGPFPEFVSSQVSRSHLRCEAYSDCRVGTLGWDQFDVITKAVPHSALRTFHENNLMQWYRWSPGSMGLDFRGRLLFTLLQLCSTFGVMESRGTLLRVRVSQKDLADLMGASRPRVTEHLAQLEREHLLIRQGRQLIVCVDQIEKLISAPPPRTKDSSAKAGAPRLNGPRSLAAAALAMPLLRDPFAGPVSRPMNNSYRYGRAEV